MSSATRRRKLEAALSRYVREAVDPSASGYSVSSPVNADRSASNRSRRSVREPRGSMRAGRVDCIMTWRGHIRGRAARRFRHLRGLENITARAFLEQIREEKEVRRSNRPGTRRIEPSAGNNVRGQSPCTPPSRVVSEHGPVPSPVLPTSCFLFSTRCLTTRSASARANSSASTGPGLTPVTCRLQDPPESPSSPTPFRTGIETNREP